MTYKNFDHLIKIKAYTSNMNSIEITIFVILGSVSILFLFTMIGLLINICRTKQPVTRIYRPYHYHSKSKHPVKEIRSMKRESRLNRFNSDWNQQNNNWKTRGIV